MCHWKGGSIHATHSSVTVAKTRRQVLHVVAKNESYLKQAIKKKQSKYIGYKIRYIRKETRNIVLEVSLISSQQKQQYRNINPKK